MRSRAGLTLVEVMVSMGLLALLAVLIVGSYLRSTEVQRKAEVKSDAYRKAAITMSYLDKTLRGVTIDRAEPGLLQFRVPQAQNGLLQVDASGNPLFGNTYLIELQTDGVLGQTVVGVSDQDRVVARLGEDSNIDFSLSPDRTLEIQLSLYDPENPAGRLQARSTVFVANQQ